MCVRSSQSILLVYVSFCIFTMACIAFLHLQTCNGTSTTTESQFEQSTSENLEGNVKKGHKNQTKVKIFKKLRVPKGTSLSLTAQVSKPKILPGFFFDDDGIILDAVVELPISLDIDKFVDAMYTQDEGTKKKKHSFAGKERCFLYKELEVFLASVLPIPKGLPRACLLRAICEIQTMNKYYSSHPQSLMIEMLQLVLSPSIGAQDDCNYIYLKAESKGKTGYCVKYMTECPINMLSLIMAQTFAPLS